MFKIMFYGVTVFWLAGFVYAMWNIRALSGTAAFIVCGFVTFCLGVLAIIETINRKKAS